MILTYMLYSEWKIVSCAEWSRTWHEAPFSHVFECQDWCRFWFDWCALWYPILCLTAFFSFPMARLTKTESLARMSMLKTWEMLWVCIALLVNKTRHYWTTCSLTTYLLAHQLDSSDHENDSVNSVPLVNIGKRPHEVRGDLNTLLNALSINSNAMR